MFVSFFAFSAYADTDGIYEGVISMYSGRKVPITISLKHSKIDVAPQNPDNMFLMEKKIEGSFVLDGEAAPYFFATSEYDPESGNLTLLYARLGNTGAPSSIPNLTFECVLLADGTCDGELTTLKGAIGTFHLEQKSTTPTPLTVTPKYVGSWHGKIT